MVRTDLVEADPPGVSGPSPDRGFLGDHHALHERRTRSVVLLSLAVMAIEIAGGLRFHSVALIADGLHMSTHAGALLIAALAYAAARRFEHDPRFAFGTGKLGDLAAFASGVGLAAMAVLIAVESVQRLFRPQTVAFGEAAAVAGLGLVVSLVSARRLAHGGHDHAAHSLHHLDLNIWAARLHMLTDVATSALTVGALLLGLGLGWTWLDPATGLLGAAVVAGFAIRLMRSAGAVLLDMDPDPALSVRLRAALEVGGERLEDWRLWRVGPGRLALVARIAGANPSSPDTYRMRLERVAPIAHATIETVTRER